MPAATGILGTRAVRLIIMARFMKCFVTGITGFIGSRLAEFLRKEGHEVWGLSTSGVGPGIRRGDLLDPQTLRAALVDLAPEAVFHLAGQAATGVAQERPDETMRLNVEGTLQLLEAVRMTAPEARVLLATSAAVYGTLSPEHLPATEEAPLKPSHPYAVSKACVHYLGRAFAAAYGLAVVEARLFNVIGPGQGRGFVVPDLAAQLAAGAGELRVRRLEGSRDFVDVHDAARAIAWVGLEGEAGDVYHVCSGKAVPIRAIVELLVKACGRPVRVVDTGEGGPGAAVSVGSAARLLKASGWKPEVPLEQSVREAYADWARRESVKASG